MKKFLVRCFVVAIIACIPFVYLLTIRVDNYPIPQDRNILILGDSQTTNAINDSIFCRSYNLSRPAEPFLFALINLKAILNSPNNIDTLLLSFGSDCLRPEQRPTIGSMNYSMSNKIRYSTLLDLSKISNNPFYFLPYIYNYAKNPSKYSSIGGYMELNGCNIDESIIEHNDHFSKYPQRRNLVSKSGLPYRSLVEIKELCENNNIKLFLLGTPLYRPREFHNKERFAQQFRDSLSGFTYVDFSDFELPDSCYYDLRHLNTYGATFFSEYLQNNKNLFQGATIISAE